VLFRSFVATRFGGDGRLLGTTAVPQAAQILDAALSA